MNTPFTQSHASTQNVGFGGCVFSFQEFELSEHEVMLFLKRVKFEVSTEGVFATRGRRIAGCVLVCVFVSKSVGK